MRRALTRLAGVAVAGAVLAAAALIGFGPRRAPELVIALPGQNGVVAGYYRGKPAADSGGAGVVRLTSGARAVDVLRLDGADPALRWLGPAKLMVCIGDAEVYLYRPDVEIGPGKVEILVAPRPAADCAP